MGIKNMGNMNFAIEESNDTYYIIDERMNYILLESNTYGDEVPAIVASVTNEIVKYEGTTWDGLATWLNENEINTIWQEDKKMKRDVNLSDVLKAFKSKHPYLEIYELYDKDWAGTEETVKILNIDELTKIYNDILRNEDYICCHF